MPTSSLAAAGGLIGICEQVKLWASADIVLTPNGAHFVNAPFMQKGGIIIEGVPWGMREYLGQAGAVKLWCGHPSVRGVESGQDSERVPKQYAQAPQYPRQPYW